MWVVSLCRKLERKKEIVSDPDLDHWDVWGRTASAIRGKFLNVVVECWVLSVVVSNLTTQPLSNKRGIQLYWLMWLFTNSVCMKSRSHISILADAVHCDASEEEQTDMSHARRKKASAQRRAAHHSSRECAHSFLRSHVAWPPHKAVYVSLVNIL